MMAISISLPTMDNVMEFGDQTDILLDYFVLTKLYIPPQ